MATISVNLAYRFFHTKKCINYLIHFENVYLQNMQPQNVIAILAELLSATLIIPPVACTYQYYAVFLLH